MESWNPSIQNWIAVLPGTKQAVISIASSSILTPDAREEKNNLFIGYWNRTQDACLASGRSFHHPKTSLLRKAQGWFLQGSEVRIPAESCSIVEPNRRNYYFFGRPETFFRSKPEFFGIGRFYLDLERTHFVIFKGIMAAPRLSLLRHFAEMTSRYRNERCCLHKEEFSKKNLSLMWKMSWHAGQCYNLQHVMWKSALYIAGTCVAT